MRCGCLTVRLMDRNGDVASEVKRVLVIDDHRTFADLLSHALEAEPDFTSVGYASTAAEGVAKTRILEPDIVVADIAMPTHDGLSAARQITELRPEVAVVVVSAHSSPEWVVRAAQAGACAYAPKSGSLPELLDVLRRVRVGSMLVAPSMFAAGQPEEEAEKEVPVRLTQRERDVLACMGKGMAPKAIARALGISLHTCRGYAKSLHAKLGVHSQLEAVIRARELGIFGPENER